MKLSSSIFLKNCLLQPNQQTKREIHRNTNNPKKKQKANHDIRSLFCRADERRNEEQTASVKNKSDKQYHEVINID